MTVYKIHRMRRGASPIAEEVVKFWDERAALESSAGHCDILDAYVSLYERCQKVAPLTKAEKPRNLTSLVSKCLWLCYPEQTAIYDDYAVRSLQVITKMIPHETFPPTYSEGHALCRYAPFQHFWMRLYEQAEPIIRKRCPDCHPIRIMDKTLWLLGKKRFGLLERPLGSETTLLITGRGYAEPCAMGLLQHACFGPPPSSNALDVVARMLCGARRTPMGRCQ